MDPVTLETPRLLLRPFASTDSDAVLAACQDKDIQLWTPMAAPFGREEADKYVGETASQGWLTDRDYILGAFRKDDGDLIGSFCLTRISQGVYEIGYWADRRQRRQGYSAEAARALCDWGFRALDAHRIEWWAMTGNTSSLALAEKLGFTVEGTLRNRSLVRGRPHDWWVGGLLKPPSPDEEQP
jgi:RimJ/RimL family protein N-acetyltransferase